MEQYFIESVQLTLSTFTLRLWVNYLEASFIRCDRTIHAPLQATFIRHWHCESVGVSTDLSPLHEAEAMKTF
jgi:hypothetical protein